MGFVLSAARRASCMALAQWGEQGFCLQPNRAAIICNTTTDLVTANPNYEDPPGDAKYKTTEEARAIPTASRLQDWRSSSGVPWVAGCYTPACQWPLPCWAKRDFLFQEKGLYQDYGSWACFLKKSRGGLSSESPVHTEILRRAGRKTMSV